LYQNIRLAIKYNKILQLTDPHHLRQDSNKNTIVYHNFFLFMEYTQKTP